MKKILFVLLAVLSVSCKDWIEPKSIDLATNTLESQNSDLYKKYVSALNDYKAAAHKVMMVTFDNPVEAPRNQSQRLTALPDSVDYIVLTNPAEVHEQTVRDMAAVRKLGTRVLFGVDFTAIQKEWDDAARADATLTEAQGLEWITARVKAALAFDGFDGITFAYSGKSVTGLRPADLVTYTARQNAFLAPIREWRAANAHKSFIFIGNFQNILEENREFVAAVDYIVLPTEFASDPKTMAMAAQESVAAGAPDDRFVFRVYMADAADENQLLGYSGVRDAAGNKRFSVEVTGEWVSTPQTGFAACGMLVMNASLDYYTARNYAYIAGAIGTMNP